MNELKTETNEAELRSTAVHEAGYAVDHIRLEINQAFASIVPKEGSQGRFLADDDPFSRAAAEGQVVTLCAG